MAESNVAVAQKQAEDFEKSRHFVSLEIDGEQWSLVNVDQDQRGKERAIELNQRAVSAYRKRLYGVINNPIKLYGIHEYKENAAKAKERIKKVGEEIKQLQPIRERVTEFIEARREVLRGNVEQEKQSARTLSNALGVEIDLHLNAGQEIPQPEFSAQELDRLEENATKLRDSQMLTTLQNYLEQHYGETQQGIEKITAGVDRVEESANASLRSASDRIRSFIENREFFPVSFKASDGSEKTFTLNELAPKTIGEKVASYFSISQRAEIAAVQQALDQHQTDLLQERDLLQQFAQGAGEIAKCYRDNLRTLNRAIPQTQFSANGVEGIENFAEQQTVASLGTPFEAISVSTTSGGGISIINPAEQAAQGTNLWIAHQRSTTDDHLEQARQMLDKVSAESGAANKTGMGAGLAADTEAAGSEALAALL